MTAEALAAHLRTPTNLAEHLTEAALVGLDLNGREMVIGPDGRGTRTGPTLRERIEAFWGAPRPDWLSRNANRAAEYTR